MNAFENDPFRRKWLICTFCFMHMLAVGYAAPNGFNGSVDADWSNAGNWDLELPGASAGNTAIIQNGRTVNLSSDFTGANLFDATIRDASILNISAGISNIGYLRAGNNDGHYGTINHSAGTVSATGMVVGNSAGTATADSNYNQTGGTVNTTGVNVHNQGKLNVNTGATFTLRAGAGSSINGSGQLNLNGGTLTIDKDANGVIVTGDGVLNVNSGTFNSLGNDPNDMLTMHHDVRVVDGTVNLSGQNYFGGEFRMVGDAATIQISRLNSNTTLATDFFFEMDADGISAITNTNWMDLGDASITVDASAYTGGAGTFTLFDTNNLAGISSSLSVTGLANGLSGLILQDQENDIVTLRIVPEPAQAVLLLGLFAAGLIFVKRAGYKIHIKPIT